MPPLAIAPIASSGCPGMAELADEEDVERRSERPRDLARHGHAAARQAEHDDVRPAEPPGQPLGEQPTRLGPVTETPAAPHRPESCIELGMEREDWNRRWGERGFHCEDDPVDLLEHELGRARCPGARSTSAAAPAATSIWLAEQRLAA